VVAADRSAARTVAGAAKRERRVSNAIIQPVRGMNDVLPTEIGRWQFVDPVFWMLFVQLRIAPEI
jgi:hypothetical protein